MKNSNMVVRSDYALSAQPVAIARKGTATADIVIARGASAPVKHAAAELADFLGRATGGKFNIRRRPGKAKYHLLVGAGAARLADASFTADGLGPEEIILRTVGKNIVLAGGEPRGTLYAVYTFLEEQIGCRWWSSTASSIPAEPALTIAPLNVCYAPPLEYRYSFWKDAFEPDWAVRNKSNGPEKLDRPAYGGRMTHGGQHTFLRLIPPQKYFHAHPEWFSLIKGKRTHEKAQLCLTNPHLLKELVRNLKQLIRKTPGQRIFSVSQNDWFGNCQCPKCKALDDREGSPAGSMLYFVNAVAEEIEKEFPQVMISTLAYLYTRKAPKFIRPRPNVVIQLCTIECSFSAPLAHERNRAFRDDIIAWSKIAGRLYIWDYVTNFSHYFQPHPNLRVLGPNIRFFVAHNVKGIVAQGAYTTRGAEFSELRAWVLARLLWNPRLDDRRLIAEFCNGYYGPAGRHILAYVNLIHDAVAKTGDPLGCYSLPTAKYLSLHVLSKGWQKLMAARAAVASDAVLRTRVMMAQLPVMYAFMSKWKDFQAQCKAEGATWPMPEAIETVADDFRRIARANNVIHLNEPGCEHQGCATFFEQ